MSAPLTEADLQRLLELAKQATPGKREWTGPDYAVEHEPPEHCASCALLSGDDEILGGCGNCGNIFYSQANGDFIAACDPTTVTALVEEVQRLRQAMMDCFSLLPPERVRLVRPPTMAAIRDAQSAEEVPHADA